MDYGTKSRGSRRASRAVLIFKCDWMLPIVSATEGFVICARRGESLLPTTQHEEVTLEKM